MLTADSKDFERFKNLQDNFLVFREIEKGFIGFNPFNSDYFGQEGVKGVVKFNGDSIMKLNVKLNM